MKYRHMWQYVLLYIAILNCFVANADTISELSIIAPSTFVQNYDFPMVVYTNNNGERAFDISGNYQLSIQGQTTTSDTISIKKGAGYTLAGKNILSQAVDISVSDFIGSTTVTISDNIPEVHHSGTLSATHTWSSDSIHIVDSELTISQSSVLIIEEGCIILIAPDATISVSGTLNITGSERNPVIFTALDESAAWGGISFNGAQGTFSYTFFIHGGGDESRAFGHSGSQPVIMATYSEVAVDHCYFMYNPGKAFGGENSQYTLAGCLIARCDTGGEFMYCETHISDSHILDMPSDDGIFSDDDNDGFYFNSLPSSGIGSTVEHCFFVTGKDDGIDQNGAKVTINNTWIDGFAHEGVATSTGDTVRVTNTVIKNCEQGIEAGYGSPQVIVDHCVVVENDVGIRFGDSYDWGCTGHMQITNSIVYGNSDNIKNYDILTGGSVLDAIDISYSMTNDTDYNDYPNCITGIPQFDNSYALLPGSTGINAGINGMALGLEATANTLPMNVYINEVKAVSDNAYCDEYGEFDDWVELYNAGSTPVDIAGMYITDDPLNPVKWKIPASSGETVIGAESYKILWLDRDTDQGPLHMDMQLSGDGEYVGLFSSDGTTVNDSISFLSQSDEYSLGRDWNAGGNWRLYSTPTPGLDNAFDSTVQVKEYYITCDPTDFEYIYAHYDEDIYIPITITHASRSWTDVSMRIRGESSRKYPKKSLRVEFDSQPFMNNRDVIFFNAEYGDASYLHQYLASLLFNESGHPAFTVEYARVYLNGSFLGLYTRVESVDEDFLTARDMDPNGNLYKAAERGACLSTFDDIAYHWDKKTNENNNDVALANLIDQLNNTPDDEYYEFARKHLDYDLMVNILAVNFLIGNYSTYYHNYYMYQDSNNTGKWMMLPWDLDKTFGTYDWDMSYLQSGWWDFRTPDNPFHERAGLCEPIMDDIIARVDYLGNTLFNQAQLGPVIDSIKTLISPSVIEDTTDNISTIADWEAAITSTYTYISSRSNYLEQQFTQWPRSFRLFRTPEPFTDTVSLSWTRSHDPNNDPVTYSVLVGTDQRFSDGTFVTFSGLTDTVFVLPQTPEIGTYYWTVYATDGENTVQGYDMYNTFSVRAETVLPDTIASNMTLTMNDSPYTVRGDMVIPAGVTLDAEPGTTLLMGDGANINVHGTLDFNGTLDNPVVIKSEHTGNTWGTIYFDSSGYESHFTNVSITGATGHETNLALAAAISGAADSLTLDTVSFSQTDGAISLSGGAVHISNCTFSENAAGKHIELINMTATIENCTFALSEEDAIYLDAVTDVVISDCVIQGSNATGITATNTATSISIDHVVITHCQVAGIAVHNNSHVTLDHLSLYANGTSLLLSELTSDAGGGHLTAENSIFSQSANETVSIDASSSVTITYSLFDTTALAGEGNITGTPAFAAPLEHNFALQSQSPAIDTGNPLSENDADGTRTDMGAYPYITPSIVINEINYHSSSTHDTGDWIELYNAGQTTLDLSGWIFQDQNDDNSFVIPDGTTMPPDSYLVIANDRDALLSYHDIGDICIGDFDFGLSGSDDIVRLYDAMQELADSVWYNDTAEWGLAADGLGGTLSLVDPAYDNALASSWTDSIMYGTPGKRNDSSQAVETHGNHAEPFELGMNYPNPFNAATVIPVTVYSSCHLKIDVYSINGQKIDVIFDDVLDAGTYTFPYAPADIPSGILFYRVTAGDYEKTGRMMLVK